jgi:transcription initiation factor IIE alpha subunit
MEREFECPKCGHRLVKIGYEEKLEERRRISVLPEVDCFKNVCRHIYEEPHEERFWCECQRCRYWWNEDVKHGRGEKPE